MSAANFLSNFILLVFQVRSAGVSGPLCHAIRDLISTAFSGSAGGEEREKKNIERRLEQLEDEERKTKLDDARYAEKRRN